MRKLSHLFIALGILLCSVSCSFTEEIVIANDGAIDYSYQIGLPEVGLESTIPKKDLKKLKKNENKMLSTKEVFSMMNALNDEAKSKSKEEQERFNQFKDDFSTIDFMHFMYKISGEDRNIKIKHRAASVEQFNLNNIKINEIVELSRESAKEEEINSVDKQINEFSKMKLFYDGKTFKRNKIYDKKQTDERLDKDEEGEESRIFSGLSELLSFNIKYVFPKPIESTSLTNVQFSSDRKTMTKTFTLDDILELEDFSVEF